MLNAWRALSSEQKRVWTAVSGAIIVGSIIKVAYFNVSRKMMVEDSNRIQRDGLERLREAREFAEWSKKDRESRLPKLTEDQRDQMREYLKVIEQHGLAKAFESPNGKGCDGEGCPVLAQARKAVATVVGSSSN